MVIDRKVVGGAAAVTLTSAMTASVPGVGQTFTVDDATGYPPTGAFVVVIDRSESNEEKVLVSSRSGTTFTVGQRAYDGTTASSHTSSVAIVEHALDAVSVQLLFDHVDGIEVNPHSGVLLDATDHDVEARHQFGSGQAFGVPVTPTALTPDIAGAAGTGNNPAREDHVHNVPAGVPVAVGTALSEGAGATFARNDHVHELGAGSIDSTTLFGSQVVPAAALVNDSITATQLAANAVGASELATGAVAATADIADGIISLAKLLQEDPTNFDASVTFTNPTGNFVLGSGGTKTARYFSIGKLRLMFAHFTLGTSGNITAGGSIEVSLPDANNANFRGFCAARARDASTSVPWSGTGVIATSGLNAVNFATAGSANVWDATNPFNWEDGDSLDVVLVWVTA